MPAKTKTIRHTIRLQGSELKKVQLANPLYEKIDLTRIAKTQNYQGYSAAKVKDIVLQLQVKETLELLLAALK
jgi:hypothetical protein